MAVNFFVQLLIGLIINIIAYAILPRPKKDKPPAVSDLENPTAEAGRPIPVVFGTVTLKSANIIAWADKGKVKKKVKP